MHSSDGNSPAADSVTLLKSNIPVDMRAVLDGAYTRVLTSCDADTTDGMCSIDVEQLRQLVLSAQKGMRRASAARDTQRHALEGSVAAAARTLLDGHEAADGASQHIQLPVRALQQALESALDEYLSYVEHRKHSQVPQSSQKRPRARNSEEACSAEVSKSPAQVPSPPAEGLAEQSVPDSLTTHGQGALHAVQPDGFELAGGPAQGDAGAQTNLLDVAAHTLHAQEVQRLLACATLPEPDQFFAALQLPQDNGFEQTGQVERLSLERRARAAARKLCLLTHPDKVLSPGSSEAFLLVQRAVQHFACATECL